MTLGIGAWMTCDDCGAKEVSNHTQIATFKGILTRAGWLMADPGFHYCPPCAKRRADHPNGPWFPVEAPNRQHSLTDNPITQRATRKATP